MKKLHAISFSLFLFALSAAAHDMSASGSKTGLFGLKPEYIHVLLNPLLGYGLGLGVLLLAGGFLLRNRTTRNLGLIVTAACAASAWPVLVFGQHGYNSLSPMLDTESHQWLDTHMERAERFIYLFYATAVLGVAALAFLKKSPKAATILAALTLGTGVISLGVGAWIARAGGEVSHSEFRNDDTAPQPSIGHHHDEHESAAEPSASAASNDAHQHGAPASSQAAQTTASSKEPVHDHQHPAEAGQTPTNSPAHEHENASQPSTNTSAHQHEHSGSPPQSTDTSAGHHPASTNMGGGLPSRLTDTPERLWTQLHRHQAELQAAITAGKLDQIQAHAVAVKQLTDALVEVVHPDHKVAVQKGAENVDRLVSEVHKSAHAEDLAAVEANFKQFTTVLHDLDELMKKQ